MVETLKSIRALTVFFVFNSAASALADTGFLDRQVTIERESYHYQVYVPPEFPADKKWPVIVYLHGNGAQGDDGIKQMTGGLAGLIRSGRSHIPAIVVFPQARRGTRWSTPVMEDQVIASLEATVKEFACDSSRLYLIGYSMGGQGVLRMASRWPDRFAALVDISGTVIARSPSATDRDIAMDIRTHPWLAEEDLYSALAQIIREVPIWIFHGKKDDKVPVEQSRHLAEALRGKGVGVRYTEYADGGHDIFEKAIREPELFTWLFTQKRKPDQASGGHPEK